MWVRVRLRVSVLAVEGFIVAHFLPQEDEYDWSGQNKKIVQYVLWNILAFEFSGASMFFIGNILYAIVCACVSGQAQRSSPCVNKSTKLDSKSCGFRFIPNEIYDTTQRSPDLVSCLGHK